ncbi:MAG: lipid A deacylase LpxR family protein [Cyclobacteriaceae bacterium]
MRKKLIFFIATLSILSAEAQTNIMRFEGQLIVDNDAFTGNLEKDQYYSSGIYAAFRHLKDSSHGAKVIRSYQLNHQMYTPSWIGERLSQYRDRPYAGVVSFSLANEYYFKKGHYLRPQLELGWLGPKALMGETQTQWHDWFGMQEPLGWEDQIQDTPLIGLNLTHINTYFASHAFELAGESNLKLGTVYNLLRYDLVMRVGNLKPLTSSAYTSSSLGDVKVRSSEKKTVESYFFYSPGMEYVIYNATLQGGLFDDTSVFTTSATKWIWQHRAGAMFSWSVFDLGITAVWRRKANPEATNHNYVGIRLNQRF